jgi:hypothetical protein
VRGKEFGVLIVQRDYALSTLRDSGWRIQEKTSSQQIDRELATSSIGSVTIGYKKSSLGL